MGKSGRQQLNQVIGGGDWIKLSPAKKEYEMEPIDNDGIRQGNEIGEESISVFKRFRAKLCHYCPLCRHARKNPESTIGKILHHKYHADNCPLWKAEKEVYGEGE